MKESLEKIDKKCVICGSLLVGRQTEYCSKNCSSKGYAIKKKQVRQNNKLIFSEEKCIVCETTFIPKVYNNIYCSDKCRNEQAKLQSRKNNIKECLECGKKFIAIGNSQRCSNECSEKHRKFLNSKEYKYLHTNFENKQLYNKLYYQKNKAIILAYTKNYTYNQLKVDPSYKLKYELRSKLLNIIKNQLNSSIIKTISGCTLEKLLEHLQTTAINNNFKNFDINNYNGKEYHIDHIIPCSSFNFNNSKEVKNCFHYSNLQILTAKNNMEKHNKIIKNE